MAVITHLSVLLSSSLRRQWRARVAPVARLRAMASRHVHLIILLITLIYCCLQGHAQPDLLKHLILNKHNGSNIHLYSHTQYWWFSHSCTVHQSIHTRREEKETQKKQIRIQACGRNQTRSFSHSWHDEETSAVTQPDPHSQFTLRVHDWVCVRRIRKHGECVRDTLGILPARLLAAALSDPTEAPLNQEKSPKHSICPIWSHTQSFQTLSRHTLLKLAVVFVSISCLLSSTVNINNSHTSFWGSPTDAILLLTIG